MAHDPINFVTNTDQEAATIRLVRFIKRSTSTVLKGRKVKRGEGLPSLADIVIVIERPAEHDAEKIVPGDRNAMTFTPTADTHATHAAHDLNDDLAVLAAQNKAFKEGLLRLQALNLDEDLFIEAAEALRSKYYGQRNPVLDRIRDKSQEDRVADDHPKQTW